jgi:hypothetical protein
MRELEVKVRGEKKKLPIKFTFNAQSEFCDIQGISLHELDDRVGGEKMKLSDIRLLAWVGLKYGHRASVYNSEPFGLTVDDVGDMFDENQGLITDVFKIFVDAQPKGESEGNVSR